MYILVLVLLGIIPGWHICAACIVPRYVLSRLRPWTGGEIQQGWPNNSSALPEVYYLYMYSIEQGQIIQSTQSASWGHLRKNLETRCDVLSLLEAPLLCTWIKSTFYMINISNNYVSDTASLIDVLLAESFFPNYYSPRGKHSSVLLYSSPPTAPAYHGSLTSRAHRISKPNSSTA